MNTPVQQTPPQPSSDADYIANATRGMHSTSAYLIMMLLILKNSTLFQNDDIEQIREQSLTQGIMDNFAKQVQNMSWTEMQDYLQKLSQDSFLTMGQRSEFSNQFKTLQAAAQMMKGDSAAQKRIDAGIFYYEKVLPVLAEVLKQYAPDLPSFDELFSSGSTKSVKQFINTIGADIIKEVLNKIFDGNVPPVDIDNYMNASMESLEEHLYKALWDQRKSKNLNAALTAFFLNYLPQLSSKDKEQYNNWVNACNKTLPSQATVESQVTSSTAKSKAQTAQQELTDEFSNLTTAVETVAAIAKTMTPPDNNNS